LALVIGNAAYDTLGNPLVKATKDAEGMCEFLESTGFRVVNKDQMCDLTLPEMNKLATRFVKQVKKDNPEVALIYFSGHGLEDSQHGNLLLPVEYAVPEDSDDNNDLCFTTQVKLAKPLGELGGRTVVVFMLDCCRQKSSTAKTKGVWDSAEDSAETKSVGLTFHPSMRFCTLFACASGELAQQGKLSASEYSEMTAALLETARDDAELTSSIGDFFNAVNGRCRQAQIVLQLQGAKVRFKNPFARTPPARDAAANPHSAINYASTSQQAARPNPLVRIKALEETWLGEIGSGPIPARHRTDQLRGVHLCQVPKWNTADEVSRL